MSEDDPVLLPSNSRRLVVEFRSWARSGGSPRCSDTSAKLEHKPTWHGLVNVRLHPRHASLVGLSAGLAQQVRQLGEVHRHPSPSVR